MSTRWYPLYQKGNPQLRVFLPNFWLKLVKPERNQPNNIIQFHCSMEMTRFDVKNYLEKIYDIHPIQVNTRIALGKTHKPTNFVVKDDDVKIAYVTLPKGETFTFPNVLPEDNTDKSQLKETMNEHKKNFQDFKGDSKMPGFPTWFKV
ncbi:putative 39S ribosomal protein L23, mitochondrial [Habropoda laboriosa]|uniref:Large ribosomal subunit protein uL23m n=1 Tax=Habropoda laboriosa TaxID=597456 RepID=A0A0L7RCJ2_9HYME|nr:PREDICTED: probable 39S ribosomal protein L23, mitochondrial [Habropoda laboriosa]KOC68461.1 putative 39S ribosomal protein L23, mitochondrial [Habropoda laboriosa]